MPGWQASRAGRDVRHWRCREPEATGRLRARRLGRRAQGDSRSSSISRNSIFSMSKTASTAALKSASSKAAGYAATATRSWSTVAPTISAGAKRCIDLSLNRLTVGDYRLTMAVSRAAAASACQRYRGGSVNQEPAVCAAGAEQSCFFTPAWRIAGPCLLE